MDKNKPFGSVATKEHYKVAEEIGNEGIVLLKNTSVNKKSEPLLPIDASKYNKILVVGDNATRALNEGGGSSELKVKDMISPLDGLKSIYGDKIDYAQGYACGATSYGYVIEIDKEINVKLRAEAIAKAKEADLVIMVGGLNKNHLQDCEDGDRKTYNLPFNQDELITEMQTFNPNVVLVLLSGNAVEMPWLKNVPAIVQECYLGSMGGNSIANVLSVNVNTSGTFPS